MPQADYTGRIFVVGSLNIDTFLFVSNLPEPGETVSGKEILVRAGGKGFNQAIAAAKCDVEVLMIGAVGEERAIFDSILLGNGLSSGSLIQKDGPTGQAFIEVDDSAENRIIIISGANDLLSPADLSALEKREGNSPCIVLAQNEIPMKTIASAFEIAAKNGWVTILNTAPARDVPSEVMGNTNILICNETEAEFYLGIQIDDPSSIHESAKSLLMQGPKVLIITLGAKGAIIYTDEKMIAREAFAVTPIDTTGAGDAFCGGFAAEYLRCGDLERSLNYALAAGSLATTRIGPSNASPTHTEILDLLKESKRA